MRLRRRFADEIETRLGTLLPEAMATVWDTSSIVVAIEQLKFTSAGGIVDDVWERQATMAGVIRLELRADGIDDLLVEPLIANLASRPVHLAQEDVAPGVTTEHARMTLLDLRDLVRDSQVVSGLRFDVAGTLFRRSDAEQRPEALWNDQRRPEHVPLEELS